MQGVNYRIVEVRRKFRDYYNGELRHRYEELEPERQKYLRQFIFLFVLFLSIACAYVYFCFNGQVSEETYASKDAIKWYLVYLVIAWVVCVIPVSSFKEDTKFAVMDRILSFWGEFNYSNKGALISEDYIKKSALFMDFSEQEQDDAFKGKYHGAEIRVSEQKLARIVHTRRGRREETVFKGVLIALHLNKKCNGKIIVCGKSNFRTFLCYNWFLLFMIAMVIVPFALTFWFLVPMYLSFGQDRFPIVAMLLLGLLYVMPVFIMLAVVFKNRLFRKEKKIALEDIVFSKKWKVFADDQVEARYVLTPALMERMLAVKKLFHGNRLDFSFFGDNLLIAVHTNKDMFETTSLFKSALDYRKVQEVICQLYSIFSVIDVLKLQNESKKG